VPVPAGVRCSTERASGSSRRHGSGPLLAGFQILIAALLLGIFPEASRAQESDHPRRSYVTHPVEPGPPRIDGHLNDACWATVEWASEFVQWEPAEGQPPTHQTAFKILYDSENLYIAYRAYDTEPNAIASLLSRRDGFPGDWVEINIDSYHDRRTAYSFTSSVSGVRGDEFVSSDGDRWDSNWDPIWDLATQVDSLGWTAEVRIPLSQLRFSDQPEQVWGIQVQRRLFRMEERSLWQPKSKDETGWVSRFGELRGIRGIHAGRQVEILPYTLARGERFEGIPGDPFRDGSDGDLQFGLDGKFGVTSNLTLDLTLNPDFGQVEADPSEVNLTAFETRFDEKRPFFIEGQSILDLQLAPAITGGAFTSDNLFYSRRIGRSPHGYPDFGAGEHADIPGSTTIIAASKLTGRTAGGLSIGALESVTAEEQAHIDAPGGQRDVTIEPLTNFFVGRLQQEAMGGNLRLGGMATAVNRRLEPGLESLHSAAYTGGLDFARQWHNKYWYVEGTVAASRVEGSPAALIATQRSSARYFQRPDNDYESVDTTRTSLSGHAGSVLFGRSGGNHWRFQTGAAWRSPGFEINDAGFMQRADEVNQFGWGSYAIRNPFAIFRRFQLNFNEWFDWDFGGTNLTKRANTNFNLTFKTNWELGGGTTRSWEGISNTELRGGPSFRVPGGWDTWIWTSSDQRRPVYAGFEYDWGIGDDDSWRYRTVSLDMTVRPSNALRFTFSPSYSATEDELQYVSTTSNAGESRYLFGRIDQETFSLTVRLDYTLRPNLTLQFYGAPFVSAGDYNEFKRITAPRAGQYEDRFRNFAADEIHYDPLSGNYAVDEDRDGTTDYQFRRPDFNVREFNANMVVRWEFQPGSVVYAVWSQARSDSDPTQTFALRNDMRGLFDVQAHNVFLLKVSKWFAL